MYCRFIYLRRLPGKTTNFNAEIHLKDNPTTKGAVYFMKSMDSKTGGMFYIYLHHPGAPCAA